MKRRELKYTVQENVHAINPDHDTNQQQELQLRQLIAHGGTIENIPASLELKSKAKHRLTNLAKRKNKIKTNISIKNTKQPKITEVP